MEPSPAPPARPRPSSRFADWAYGAVLAVILLSGAWMRFDYSQQPWIDGDTWGYLNPAFSKLIGGEFVHTYGRDSLYPAFLYAVLKLCGDFRAVSIVQHLFGLGTGVLLALAWNAFCRLLLAASRVPLPWRLAGLLPVTAYLHSMPAFEYEHSLRPEALFPFFAILSLWLNLEFIRHRWRDPAPNWAAWLGAAGIIVSIVLYKLKPSFGFGVVFVNLPLLASLCRPGMSWRLKTAMAGGAAVFCLTCLILPESILKRRDLPGSLFLPDTLFTIHADIIDTQLENDLARNVPAPYPREILAALHDSLRERLPASRQPENRPYPSLGFSPDYLLYTNSVFRPVFDYTPAGMRLHAGVVSYCYRRAAWGQPRRMLGKVLGQLGCFYRFGTNLKLNPGHARRVSLTSNYQRNVDLLETQRMGQLATAYAPGRSLREDSPRLAKLRQSILTGGFSNAALYRLNVLYLPGLLAALAAAGWAWWNPARRREWLLPIGVTLLVYSYNFGNNLTIAIVHSLDIARYIANELAFTLFASAAGLAFTGMTLWKFAVPKAAADLAAGAIKWPALPAWSGGAPAPALPRPVPGSSAPTLCVLIPCYNEEPGVPQVVADYRRAFPEARLLVIDNNSSDGTARAAAAAGAEVLFEPGRGKARAVLSGLCAVDSDLVLMVDGDGSYPAEGGQRLVASYLEAPVDLLTGIRFGDEAAGGSFRPLHQGGTQLFGRILGWVFGWQSEDVFSGLRLFSRRYYRNVPILSRGFELELELTVQAIDKGFSLREIPVPFGQRAAGTASKLRTVHDGLRILRLMFVLFRDYRPLLCFGALAALLAATGLLAGSAPIHDYIAIRYVTHVPLAILAASLMILAALALQTGLMLESVLRRSREAYQLRLRDFQRG